jgi:hypothetical protein
MKYGWALCVTLLCGCSNLKTAGMRDARVLDRGKWEFTLESSSTASVSRAVLRAAERENPDVSPIVDSSRKDIPATGMGGLMFVLGMGRGMAGGWEWNAALGFPPGGSLLDAGLKKRVYDRNGILLAGYARLAAGSSAEDFGITDWNILLPTAPGAHGMRLESESLEGDLALLSLYRVRPWFSVYCNLGATAGSVNYHIRDISDSTAAVPAADGDVSIYGLKNHLGLVLEWKRVEWVLEPGIALYGHATVPSIGTRITFKNGMKK